MSINDVDQPEGTTFAIPVEPDKLRSLRVFVSQPKQYTKEGQAGFHFIAEDKQSFEADTYDAFFEAPEK